MLGMWKIAISTLIIFSFPLLSWAEPAVEPENSYFSFEETVTNSANKNSQFELKFKNPTVVLLQGVQAFAEVARAASISLIKWQQHDGNLPTPAELYNRKKHFGGWVNDKNDDTCYSTRVKVLIRDSKTAVVFKDNNPCMVESGTWDDPYTNTQIAKARDIDIDHMVPLKNAFTSGAWTWTYEKRCLFANFAANDYHLKAVDFLENRTKGDQGPDHYLPRNNQYVCQYLEAWLKIKLIWNLEMTSSEARAIQGQIQSHACDIKQFKMSPKELAEQRKATVDLQKICDPRNMQNMDSDEEALFSSLESL